MRSHDNQQPTLHVKRLKPVCNKPARGVIIVKRVSQMFAVGGSGRNSWNLRASFLPIPGMESNYPSPGTRDDNYKSKSY